MSTERKQVLELLAQRKITAEEAERLLDKLDAAAASADRASVDAAGPPKVPKFFCIHVDSKKGDKVDLRLPFALVRTGIKLSALVPKDAAETMTKNGVDLAQLSTLSDEELAEALRTMTVDVESRKGDQVRVYCE